MRKEHTARPRAGLAHGSNWLSPPECCSPPSDYFCRVQAAREDAARCSAGTTSESSARASLDSRKLMSGLPPRPDRHWGRQALQWMGAAPPPPHR